MLFSFFLGYGNITPITIIGRWALILYALVGMPLALTMYSVAGKLVVQLITYLLDMFQSRVNKKPGVEVSHLQLKTLSLSVVLFLLIILIGCCVTGAPSMENLDFSSSFYFWFISLSTIGYGDITFKRDKHLESPHMMMLAVLNLLFGIGILAAIIAAISLVLEKRDLKMSTIIIDNDDDDEDELLSDNDDEISNELHSFSRDKLNSGQFMPHETLEKMREQRKQEGIDVEADEMTAITHLSSDESLNDHCPNLHSKGQSRLQPPKQIKLTEKFKEDTLMLLKRRLTPTNSTRGLLMSDDEDQQHQHHHQHHYQQYGRMNDSSKSTKINPSFECEHIDTI